MTALCLGGPSGPLPTISGVLTIGTTAIEVFVASLGFPEMAPILAPIIAGLVDIEIASYCSTDPPADPGLTASDVENAIRIPPTLATFTAQQKILTWFEARYWWQICHCTGVGTPTPAPPTLSNPGGAVQNPGLAAVPTPCWSVTVPYSVVGGSVSGIDFTNLTPTALPAGQQVTLSSFQAGQPATFQGVLLPQGITSLAMAATVGEAFGSGSTSLTVNWVPHNSTGAALTVDGLQALFTASGLSGSSVLSKATTQTRDIGWAVSVVNGDTIDHTGTVSISYSCNPNTPNVNQCCALDPALEGLLQQILQYEQAIYAAIPVPLASFAESTVHGPLSGTGSFAIDPSTVAIKIVSTFTVGTGVTLGTPDFHFQAGYITFATVEGSYPSDAVTFVDQVVTVPTLGFTVQYTLLNGVTSTITELTRGP